MYYRCKFLHCCFASIFAFLTVSCGDKTTSGTPPQNAPVSAPPPIERPQVSLSTKVSSVVLDSAISATALARIDKIISPLGESAVGSQLLIPSNAEMETLVIGIGTGADNLPYAILAAMASSENTSLSIESTAIAFSRIAFGRLPDSVSAQQINTAIREAEEFPKLKDLLSTVIENGQSPLESPAVADSILTLLSQISPGIARMPAQTAVSLNQNVMLPIIESVNSIPFIIINDTGGLGSVYIKGGDIDVVSSMQIFWSAKSSANPAQTVELPAVSIDAKLLDRLNNPWVDINPTVVPGNQGKGFDLTIEQDTKSREKSIVDLFNRMSLLIGDLLLVTKVVPEECKIKLLTTLMSSDEYLNFADDTSPDQFKKFLSSIAFKPAAIEGIVSTCIKEPAVQASALKNLGTFASVTAKGVSGFAIAGQVYDAVGIATSATQLYTYWSRSETVAVCESAQPTGPFGNTRVTSCLASIEFEPKLPAMVVGSVLDPSIRAFDEKGRQTYLPAGLKISSSNPAVATIDPKTARISAKGLGSAIVTIFDPFTAISGNYKVDVVKPVIRPTSLNLAIRGLGNLELYAPDGRKVIAKGSGIKWVIDNKSIAAMTFLSWGYPAGINVIGLQNGMTRASITASQGSDATSAIVTVGAPIRNSIEFANVSCREIDIDPSERFETIARYTTVEVKVNGPVASAVEVEGTGGFPQRFSTPHSTLSCGAWTERIGDGVYPYPGLDAGAHYCKRAPGDPAETQIRTLLYGSPVPTSISARLYEPQSPDVPFIPTGGILSFVSMPETPVCSQQ